MRAYLLPLLGLPVWAAPPRRDADNAARAEAFFNQALGTWKAEERVALLTRAVKLQPRDARYRVMLGDAHCDPGDVPGDCTGPLDAASGRSIYLEAMRAVPNSPLPHLRLAGIYWPDDPVAAAAHLEKAMALDPENALAVYQRALLHFLAGEEDQGTALMMAARCRKGICYPLIPQTVALTPEQAEACAWLHASQLVRFQHFRHLASEIVRVAGGEDDALLIEGQRLAYRVMSACPATMVSLFVGCVLDERVSKALDERLLACGDPASMERHASLQERAGLRDTLRKKGNAILNRMLESSALEKDPTDPATPVWVWRDEAEAVTKLLAESGLKETLEE